MSRISSHAFWYGSVVAKSLTPSSYDVISFMDGPTYDVTEIQLCVYDHSLDWETKYFIRKINIRLSFQVANFEMD